MRRYSFVVIGLAMVFVNAIASLSIAMDAPYCGLYSVYAGVRALGIEADIKNIIDPRFVSTEKGSSAAELVALADRLGASGEFRTQMSISSLRSAETPIVLHVSVAVESTGFHHWVLFLGMDGDEVKLYEPPTGMSVVSPAELLSLWDGSGIVITRPEQPLAVGRLPATWMTSAETILACILVASLALGFRRVPQLSRAPIVSMLCIALISGSLWHLSVEYGFFWNRMAIRNVTSNFDESNLPIVSSEQFAELVDTADVTVVDARLGIDFDRSHVPGAISIPINSDYGGLRDKVAGIPRGHRVIVYCKSNTCSWADAVARKIALTGTRDVAIFREGMFGWKKLTDHSLSIKE